MTVKGDVLPAFQGPEKLFLLLFLLLNPPHAPTGLFVRIDVDHAGRSVHDAQLPVHSSVHGKPGPHQGWNPHCPGQDGRVGVQGALGRHEGQHHVLVKLYRLGGRQVVRHNDDRFLRADAAILLSLKDGNQALGDVPYVGGPAPHVVVLHGFEHPGKLVRCLGYRVFRVDGLGVYDIFYGVLVIAVLQHHLMDLKYGRIGFPHFL